LRRRRQHAQGSPLLDGKTRYVDLADRERPVIHAGEIRISEGGNAVAARVRSGATEHTIIVRCGSLGPSTSFTLDCVQKYVKSSDVPVLWKNNAFCTNSAEGGRPPRNADIRVQIMPPFGYGRTSVRHYRNAVAVGFPTAKPPKALATGTFAQHATTMFFPHFVGDACSRKAAAR
jgi:hypothetical protein